MMERIQKKRVVGRGIASIVNRIRIAALDRADALNRAEALSSGPSILERQQELIGFYQVYEHLVEILCDSAQYGPTPALESSYRSRRAWMTENYPSIRKFVVAYLKFEVEDAILGGDAFEALFTAEDLSTFLQADDGNMISRILRTREALNLYGDHLRQLAAAA